MSEIYGFGEYEKTDLEVKLSVVELRTKFFDTLIKTKGNWREGLFQITNPLITPKEEIEILANQNNISVHELLFRFSLPFLFNQKPYKDTFPDSLTNTPLLNFFRFVNSHLETISELEKTAEVTRHIHDDFEIRRNALLIFIKDWKTLKTLPESVGLCNSLEKFADDFNLNEIWILDFILLILVEFSARFEDSKRHAERDLNYFYHYSFFDLKRSSLFGALDDYISDRKLHLDYFFQNDWEIKPFVYEYQGFTLIETFWLPYLKRKAAFTKETIKEVINRIKLIKDFNNKYEEFNSDIITFELEEYCNAVETTLSEDKVVFSYNFNSNYYAGLLFIGDYWSPAEVERKKFFENALKSLRLQFYEKKKLAESLENFKKGDLELALYSYCLNIEKNKPSNYKKTPRKHTGNTHFECLIKYQIVPFDEYAEIAKETGNSESAVKRGIARLGKELDLTLRKPTRKGRPKGIKESHKRNRVNNYKNNRKRNILKSTPQ